MPAMFSFMLYLLSAATTSQPTSEVRLAVVVGNNIGLFWCWGVKYGLAEGNQMDGNRSYGISIGHCDTDNVMRKNRIMKSGKVGILFRDEALGALPLAQDLQPLRLPTRAQLPLRSAIFRLNRNRFLMLLCSAPATRQIPMFSPMKNWFRPTVRSRGN